MADATPGRWSRRALIGGALALAGGAGYVLHHRRDRGAPHSEYFLALSRALAAAGVARPVLIIDRARLAANIAAVHQTLAGSPLATRIVVKSLPVPGLLDAVSAGLGTDRCMVFNGPMVLDTLKWKPTANLLLGKPLPAAEVARVLDADPTVATADPQWLADSVQRLQDYAAVARARGIRMRVNLEIDVGLHRGGLAGPAEVAAAFDAMARLPELQFAGLMGYDPHVPKMPRPESAYRAVVEAYGAALEVVRARVPASSIAALTLNTAGSPTYRLHVADPNANEVAIGSAFVKPRDFDLDTLSHHVPAAFIATPVLKVVDPLRIPGLEALGGVFRALDANAERGFFVYGGHWLAEPESPPGLEYNAIYGRSSNQELLTGSRSVPLRPDDYVFLRPSQSEAVLLQFGDLLVYENGAITSTWPTFPVSA
jgi:D-serine deaminase-like pyridoxal phosphate-dependent protein